MPQNRHFRRNPHNKKVRIVVTRKKVSFNNVFIVRATHGNENLTIICRPFFLGYKRLFKWYSHKSISPIRALGHIV